jgi:flagellar basal-body rod modification protein FlgD
MSISAIGGSSGAGAANSLTMEDFLKVLLTQLTYQDPLKPLDNQQFMAQIAQFTTLQQTQELNENMARLLNNQAALQSVGLLGRTVTVTTEAGSITGRVTALSWAGATPKLTVEPTAGTTLSDIDLSQITAVRP